MRTIAAARSKDILRHCWLHDVRDMLVPYSVSLEWQRSLLLERLKILREIRARNATVCTSTMNLPQLSGIQSDAIIALEHPSVYTLGRRCGHDHLKFNPEEPRCPHEVHQVERGGNVTWHGPGQLVVYPILDLRHHKMDLGWYQRSLEEVVIRVLADHGIKGTRDKTATGVWVDGAKIAAIGVGVSRWITLHGFSLNICPSMDGFSRIIPCGIPDKPVASLRDWKPHVTLPAVREQVLHELSSVFGLQLENRVYGCL
eukprot:165171_1